MPLGECPGTEGTEKAIPAETVCPVRLGEVTNCFLLFVKTSPASLESGSSWTRTPASRLPVLLEEVAHSFS